MSVLVLGALFSVSQGAALEPKAKALPLPPQPEPIDIVELPLPPVSWSNVAGACNSTINPRGTGCITPFLGSQVFQSGGFTPDGKNVIANVEFVGAPVAPDPASIYHGEQIILIKADGTKFPNGDAWKCLSCGVPAQQARGLDPERDYPFVYRSGDKALWGHNVFDCDGALLQDIACIPSRAHIYPIHWSITVNDSGAAGVPRELRLHPDGTHLGFNSFTPDGGQIAFLGRLEFNSNPSTGEPRVPRYDIVDVKALLKPNNKSRFSTSGSQLVLNEDAIIVSELRGFSGSGNEVLYIGYPMEANNIDVFATHLTTGVTRQLTNHPGYIDPVAFTADDKWFVAMDNRPTDRQMWLAGLRDVPPLIDAVTVIMAAATRNNGARRFFQPILLDKHGDREPYYGQVLNAAGDGTNGAVNDPNWNGRADPAVSLDGTKIVYWQSLVTSPDCGGSDPLPCPVSTAQGGRHYRVMLARLTRRKSTRPAPVFKVPTDIPWATPYQPGAAFPTLSVLQPGNYTLQGKKSGSVKVSLVPDNQGRIATVHTNYTNYSSDGKRILNG